MRPTRRGPVLLALHGAERPTIALLRAWALARIRGVDVHVVRIVAGGAAAGELAALVEHAIQAAVETRAWVADAIGDDDAVSVAVEAMNGPFARRISAYAGFIGAQLVVLSTREGLSGGDVTFLVAATGVPVLVARGVATRETVLAATKLHLPDVPVLHAGADLAQELGAELVAVHHVESPPMREEGPAPRQVLNRNRVRAARDRRLAKALRGLPVRADSVVRTGGGAVHAIVDEAAARDSDLIIVGTRRRRWLERVVFEDTAAAVIDHAHRSVLVVPIAREMPPGARCRGDMDQIDVGARRQSAANTAESATIVVSSKVGHGSEVTVDLPAPWRARLSDEGATAPPR